MVTSSSIPTPTRPTTSARRLVALIVLLFLLSALAVYVWTLPARRERALRAATFSQLFAQSKKEPKNSRVFYHMGLRLQSMGQVPPSRAAFARAAYLDEDDEDSWLAWAVAAGNMGNEQEAFQVLNTFAKKHPRAARIHKSLATFYYAEDVMDRAYQEALAATRVAPDDAAAWRLAGVSAMGFDYFTGATEAFKHAVKLAPKDWRGVLGLGDALDHQERHAEALAYYRQANALAPDQATTTLAVGRTLLAQAKTPAEFLEAQQVLEKAVSQNPSAGYATMLLGRTYRHEAQWEKARDILQRAERLDPKSYEVAYELEQVFTRLGDTARANAERKRHDALYSYALGVYNLLTRLHDATGETDIRLRLELSRMYAAHGDYSKAAHEYRHLLQRAPKLEAAKTELANVERIMPTSANYSLNMSLQGAETNSVPTATLLRDGKLMLTQKRYSEAQTAFLTAIQRDPNNAAAQEGLGLALQGLGKTDEAFKTLMNALSLNSSLPGAQYAVAQMYYNIGLPDEATHRMEKLVKQLPNNADYLHGLGMCYVNTVRPQQAELVLAKATRLTPTEPGYWVDLADAEVKNEKPIQAEQHYRKAAQLAQNEPVVLDSLATFLLTRQATKTRWDEAEHLFSKVLAIEPVNQEALFGMGKLQVLRKNPTQAVTYLETLINHNADYTQAYYELTKAYDQLHNKDRADYCRKIFRMVSDFQTDRDDTEEQVRLHLKDPALRLKLARLYARGGQSAKALNQYKMCLSLAPQNTMASKELADLTDRLKAAGQLPETVTFNNMVTMSLHSIAKK